MAKGFSHESTALSVPVEWYTPQYIFDSLGLEFDLDPCAAPAYDNVPAKNKYVLPTDGLLEKWYGTVWLNPPYGKQTPLWINKMIHHNDGIALVFARTDTQWFQKAIETASIVCFIGSRVKFVNGNTGKSDGTPGAGSALIGWGDTAYTAISQSGLGKCMVLAPSNCGKC